MKTEVLIYLQSKEGTPEERYNAGMALLRKSEGKSIPAVNYYNRAGFTKENLKNICYDLQKLHGISDMEVLAKASNKSKVKSLKPDENGFTMELVRAIEAAPDEFKVAILIAEKYPELFESDLDELDVVVAAIEKFSAEHEALLMDNKKNLGDEKFVAQFISVIGDDVQLSPELTLKLQGLIGEGSETDVDETGTDVAKKGTDVAKNETVGAVGDKLGFITDAKRSLAIDEAPLDAKAGLKLIEEFPFLDDADCPDSLKILVQDKFTAWRNYKAAHEALFVAVEEIDGETKETALTNAELYELATEALENFELNRAIWDELNYYKEHKEILGNHPIFADEKLKEKVARMKGTELVKRRNNVRSYISKETKKLKPDTEEEAAKKIKAKIKDYNQELQLLEARIESEK